MPTPEQGGGRWVAAVLLIPLAALGGWFVAGALGHGEASAHTPISVAAVAVSAASPPGAGEQAAPPVATGIADLPDAAWVAATAASTGISPRMLRAYAGAQLQVGARDPGCAVHWTTLAALGSIESGHGTHAGSVVGDDGVVRPGIFGIDLTGAASARIEDTDDGVWDGKPEIDRAVGPMQFIPATWSAFGADGNGDGIRDPQQVDDAVLAAAHYLCEHGDLAQAEGWRRAVFAYNHLDSYVDEVALRANGYAERSSR